MNNTTSRNGWVSKRLEECTSDGVISYGIVQPGSHCDEGVPVLRVNNITNGTLTLDDVLKVAPEIEVKYKRTRLKGGEVLLTLVGSTGQSLVVPNEMKGWNVPRAIAVIRVDENIGANWVNICLQSSLTKHFLDVRANTTVQKTLNLKDVKDIPILLPPKPVRDFIENTEQGFSKKIALNESINKALEQIAQAIFKSWFVDFEPTKAKIAAREALLAENPAADPKQIATAEQQAAIQTIVGADYITPTEQLQNIAYLFPNQMVDSELGEIPEGWTSSNLNSICVLNAKTWTKKNPPSIINYVDLANTKSGVIEEITSFEWHDAPSRARRILTNGDTIVGTVRPGNRSFAYIAAENQLTGSTGFAVLTPKSVVWSEFLYIAATSDVNVDRLAHLADGGAYPAVKPAVVTELNLALPPIALVSCFHSMVLPMFDKRASNFSNSKKLKAALDHLLPKLLSSELKFN